MRSTCGYMQVIGHFSAASSSRRIAFICVVLSCLLVPLPMRATGGSGKPASAKINRQFLVFPDSVVQEQWQHTFRLVSPPQNLSLLNPGQCIRIGIISSGDGRDTFLEETQLSFRVEFAGKTQDYALAPPAGLKQLKPEGAARNSLESTASLGASADSWCVPADAQDGTATIDVEIDAPSGHDKLARTKIDVESLAAGSKRGFVNQAEFERFTMGYHYQPNPARLYPALLYFCSQPGLYSASNAMEIRAAFFGAALKADPAAAKYFTARLMAQSGCPRELGLQSLLSGGYNIDPVLATMTDSDRQALKQHSDFPDPYALDSKDKVVPQFEMLSGIFKATGQFAPIEKIASELSSHPDRDELDKVRNSPGTPQASILSMGLATAYSTPGGSLAALQRSDPLAADYIDSMIGSSDTSDALKTELKGLLTSLAAN